jgi:hypothetical protein
VILTSCGEQGDIARADQGCANGYVVKPVGFERFPEIISDPGTYWLEVNRSAPALPALNFE